MAVAPYKRVETLIAAWCERHRFTLFREWAGRPARFVYLSHLNQCLQIGLAPSEDGWTVSLFDVENRDDAEIRIAWRTDDAGLAESLEHAVRTAKHLLQRPQD